MTKVPRRIKDLRKSLEPLREARAILAWASAATTS